jgi:hypothetical protein
MITGRQFWQRMHRLGAGALAFIRGTWRRVAPLLAAGWSVVRPLLKTLLEILLALVIVFEEWGWRPLADLLGRLARWRPWAAVEALIMRLPPYAALIVFVLPTALLLPLKLLALLLIANGQVLLAGLLFIAAKVVATALIARLFMLTQPALMQIGWFAYSYDTVMPWKEALTARVRASWAWRWGRVWKERVKRVLGAAARRWRPALLAFKSWARAAADRLRIRARQLLRDVKERLSTFKSGL